MKLIWRDWLVSAGLIMFFRASGLIAAEAELWLTSPNESARFEKQNEVLVFAKRSDDQPTIEVDGNLKFQTIDGFGFCLTGGSAMHLIRMNGQARAALLKELFSIAEWEKGLNRTKQRQQFADLRYPMAGGALPIDSEIQSSRNLRVVMDLV